MKTAQPKLNPNALKWVEALESGKYKQAKYALEKIDKKGNSRFCCLGVACDIYRKSGNQIKRVADGVYAQYGESGDSDGLPDEVKSWLGVRSRDGKFLDPDSASSLVERNDAGVNFSAIAKIIRSKPEGLFKRDK